MRNLYPVVGLIGLLGCGVSNPALPSWSVPGGSSGSSSGTAGVCVDGWADFAGPFFQGSCETCHNHQTEFSSRDAVAAKAETIRMRVASGLMPPTGLAGSEQSRLLTWLDCGAPVVGGVGSTSGSGGSSTGTGGSSGGCSDTWAGWAGPFLQASCEACHNHQAEFSTPAAVLAKQSLILARVSAGQMPPGGGLASGDLARLQAWFSCQSGGSSGSSGSTGPSYSCVPDPGQGGGGAYGDGSSTMLPGHNCLACHTAAAGAERENQFEVAGTVFPAFDSLPSQGLPNLTVTLTDALQHQATAVTNSAGNFAFYSSTQHLTPPFQVAVQSGSSVVHMGSPAPTGACNTCHGQPSQCGAPGRIFAP